LCCGKIDIQLDESQSEEDNHKKPLGSLKKNIISESFLRLFTIKFSEKLDPLMRKRIGKGPNLSLNFKTFQLR
jgi:hypothetical protein